MCPIRIAAQLHPQHGTYQDIRRAALRAEELGFDILYNWDHFFPLYGDPAGPHLECWSLLAAWAEATSRIELGPLVSCNSYRNPHLLADIARTVDHISGGRVILGIGAGWARRDDQEYGFEFGTFGTRIAAMGQAIPEITGRLAALNPPPMRRMPLLIAGQGRRKTLRLVAEYADAWHAGFPERPAELEPVVDALRGWCADVGRDPAEIEWSVGVEPDDFGRFLDEDAATYHELGFTQFTLGFNGPSWEVDVGQQWLAWRDDANRRARHDLAEGGVEATRVSELHPIPRSRLL
jgi:probable F420-dependent oxidoreductase